MTDWWIAAWAVSGALAFMLAYPFLARRVGLGPDLWTPRPDAPCAYCGSAAVHRHDEDGDPICERCAWRLYPRDWFR